MAMLKKRTSLVLALAATAIALVAAFRLADAFFVREDYTYLVFSHFFTPNVTDVFIKDFYQNMWFRPMPILLWKICWVLWGFNPAVNYLVNMGLLLATGLAAGGLCRRLGGSESGAGLTALLFVSHPLAVEVAGYLTTRGDVLGALFAVLALHVHLSSRNRATVSKWAMVTVASFITLCACLSKEMFISLPLLLLFMPVTGAENGGSVSISKTDRLKEAAPHFVAVGIYAAWRAMVIGDLVGGYMYKRTGFLELLINAPLSAADVTWNSFLMFLGITFESKHFAGHLPLAIIAAVGLAFWIWKGRKIREKTALLLLAWIIIALAPLLNLREIISYSPRLVYFPVLISMIFLGYLFPTNGGRLKWAGLILLLVAWMPLWNAVIEFRRSEGEKHRKLVHAMEDYYLPRALTEPPGQYKIIFGAPSGMFTLDEMFDSYLANKVDMFSSPLGAFRFMFGDRTNRVTCVKHPDVEYTRRRYKNKWHYETHSSFNAIENEPAFGEARKAPDILELMSDGKPVEVSLYHPDDGEFTDITGLFRNALRERRGASTPPIRWSFPENAENWQTSPHLEKVRSNNESVLFSSTGEDPYMTRSVEAFEPTGYKRIIIDMRVERKSGLEPLIMHGEIHWRPTSQSSLKLPARKRYPVKADGVRRAYEVKVGEWPEWYLPDKIETLRIDPVDAKCQIEIYSISIRK